MNIAVNEEDFLQLQNIKIKEYDKSRIGSKSKDVRLEARVEKLEVKMDDVTTEIRMLNRTMLDVAETLKQLKDEQKQLHQFDIQIARMQDKLDTQQGLIKKLFDKSDESEKILAAMGNKEASNDVKIGNSERVIWLIVAGAISALGWLKNG